MSEKQVTLEDLARAEAVADEQRIAKKKAYLEGQKKLQTLMPERFYTFARQLKDGVTRFNGAAKLERILQYTETTGVTIHDPNPHGDLVVEVRRDPNSISVALRELWRLHADDAYSIEAEGVLGRPPDVDRLQLRIQGVFQGEELRWRITSEGKQVDTPIDELPDRIVAAVATGELARLWTAAPFFTKSS